MDTLDTFFEDAVLSLRAKFVGELEKPRLAAESLSS